MIRSATIIPSWSRMSRKAMTNCAQADMKRGFLVQIFFLLPARIRAIRLVWITNRSNVYPGFTYTVVNKTGGLHWFVEYRCYFLGFKIETVTSAHTHSQKILFVFCQKKTPHHFIYIIVNTFGSRTSSPVLTNRTMVETPTPPPPTLTHSTPRAPNLMHIHSYCFKASLLFSLN